jgi:hypothetical protein
MTTITVNFASISKEEYQLVIDYYNTIKPRHFLLIEELDRCEGGFKIALSDSEANNMNGQLKQLRWNKRKLDPLNFIGFNEDETLLLYRSLVHVFGESAVFLL